MTEAAEDRLPRPFYDDGWSGATRPHARALWHFHTALTEPKAPALDGTDLTAYFDAEREKAVAGGPLKVVAPDVAAGAYSALDAYGLPAELLGRQISASERFLAPIRFSDNKSVNAFITEWAASHGRLLAHLAGASGSWQLAYVDELSAGFFWVGRLITLKRDLEEDHVFIPKSDLDQAGVTVEQLTRGGINENVRRLLWKQTIRAKDAFAQSEQLVHELPRRSAAALKRWWMGGLEVLNEIERRDYDVWSEPIRLSGLYRFQVRFQARFGRTTFRSR